MKTTKVLLAGVVSVVAAFAVSNDRLAEERYRTKYGRYTPAEEARRVAERKEPVKYVGQACCRRMPHDAALAPANEAWFRAKFGRSTPAYEAAKKEVETHMAAHVTKCAELGRCPLTAVSKSPDPAMAARNRTGTEARLLVKFGRIPGAEERREQTPAATGERALLAAAEHSPCAEPCCEKGD